MMNYAKAIVAALGTALTAFASALPSEWGWVVVVAALGIALTTGATYLIPNQDAAAIRRTAESVVGLYRAEAPDDVMKAAVNMLGAQVRK